MIEKVTITNHVGDRIEIDSRNPNTSGFLIYSIAGLEPPEATINTAQRAAKDGSSFLSANIESRNIVFTLFFEPNQNGYSIDEMRKLSYKYFPIKRRIKMEFYDGKSNYEIYGYVESNAATLYASRTGTQISVICNDPYFHRDGGTETNFSDIKPSFYFPFSNKSETLPTISLGYFEFEVEKYTYYDGDIETGFTLLIEARADLGDITIYKVSTREMILIQDDVIETMTGSRIKQGDAITLNTINNSLLLVREGVTYNILNAIKRPVHWMYLDPGDNLFVVTSEIGILYMDVLLKNPLLMEGL